MNFKKILLLYTLLLFGSLLQLTQNVYGKTGGFKYFKNYTPEDYDHHPQNWMIAQDRRGVIYVANQAGLLEFDGVSWRIIPVTNQSVRSLAIDDTGTIYMGGKNEIGSFLPDAMGSLRYESMLDHLEDNRKNFSSVWRTYATQEGIYFHTSTLLFRWKPDIKKLKIWESDNLFKSSFFCNGQFFIQKENVGLMQMVDDSLTLLPGGETYREEKISIMFPYDSDAEKLVIGTRSVGLYIYDGITIVPFPTEVDGYLKEKMLYHGIRLSSGDFALATRLGGLVIIDAHGKPKQIFDKASGLQDDNVKYVFEDFQGNLWLALNEGITKIEYKSPFGIYDDRAGLPGIVLSVVAHGPQKDLYVGTTSGLYFLTSASTFRPVPGISGNCWSLLSVGDMVLAASADGVLVVDDNIVKQRIIDKETFFLLRSGTAPQRVWVGTSQGLVSLYSSPNNGTWTVEHEFGNTTESIRTVAEDNDGNLWLGTLTRGVFKVDFLDAPGIKNPVITHDHTSHGLPTGEVHVFMAAGHAMFATEKGIFRFNKKTGIFEPDPTLGIELADGSRGVFHITEDKNKNIWIHSRAKNIQAMAQPDGTFILNKKPFLRIPPAVVNTILPDSDSGGAWFGSTDGLIRYDPTVKKDYRRDFPVLIRKVQRLNDKSLVFNGFQEGTSSDSFPVFDYNDRNLRFRFAAPFFEDEASTTYRVFLEGNDDHWSHWTPETQKDYTNLDSGFYTFRVQAKNVYRHLSEEAVFRFKVLPPWYKTWWAFLLYALAALFLVYFVVRWRSWKLEKEKQHLEQIVKDRTKEIKEKNQQLEGQSEQLKEMDRIKSRFFANISHEFRTPLTLIMGPLEQILSSPPGREELEKKTKLMLRNSQRLLGLINQLLDLSKIESGKMKLQASLQNIVVFLRGIVASFEMMAVENDLDLTLEREDEEIFLYFDPEKLEKVICNLLSNALKFTPSGGKVTVSVKREDRQSRDFPCGCLEIRVTDTGIGIPGDRLAIIFDRFFQAESTDVHEHRHKGSGIGLALAKELVELHHGRIEARSREGENSGSEFILCLPLGKEHLDPGEVTDLSEVLPERPQPCRIPAAEKEVEEVEKEKDIEKDIEAEPESGAVKEEKNIILVVDDSADVRDYIRDSLEPVYRVAEAADGREGLKKAKEIIPDLIVCDIMMPEVDGYELCRAIKEDVETCHIPVILLTARASEENLIQGLETGADDYITKPFSTRILTVRIKNLIDLRRQLQLKRIRQMTLQPDEIAVSSIDESFYKELQDVVEENLSDSEFTVDQLCKKLYMGRTSLYRKVLALTGEPPTGFIRSYRLKRAAQLLKANFGNVTEVAFEVGFSSTAYFTKCFREKFHQIPSAFHETDG